MNYISSENFFHLSSPPPVLDVRTPSEFKKGHIPGAFNLPLFDDGERAEVGTLYKQKSQGAAVLRGLEIAGSKMKSYVESAREILPGRDVCVHCWRGGKRSESMGTLLSFVGFNTLVLQGGYKAYRRFVREKFAETNLKILVLGGRTGSGKTEVLQALKNLGEQIIDLEKLAHHKGSAFGALGEPPQPSVEFFENQLFEEMRHLDVAKRVWMENESKNIGRVFIPEDFWFKMSQGVYFDLEVPFADRIERLVRDYGQYEKEELIESVQKIRKRLGGQHVQKAIELFENGDLEGATAIALHYYDKAYQHATSQKEFCKKYLIKTANKNALTTAQQLITLANEYKY